MKLHLKKGFLLPENVAVQLKEESDYQWHLLAKDAVNEKIHEELSNLSFPKAYDRGREMIGKKISKKIIKTVLIFGDLPNIPKEYTEEVLQIKDSAHKHCVVIH